MALNGNPRFPVRLRKIKEPLGHYTHAISVCPRCKRHIGVTAAMVAGIDSIICKGKFPDGRICNGHYYYRKGQLEFVGTVKEREKPASPLSVGR